MSIRESITRSNFFIKLTSWEYWPFGVIQFPLFFYFAWLSLRARSLIFFSASNPGIAMGGMFGESKYDVIKKIPRQYIPKTILVASPTSKEEVLKMINDSGFHFPVIFKPDLGERGFMVTKITEEREIEDYLRRMKYSFLIQELVDLPLEFGVFYTRFPNDVKGNVTSIVMKEMLTVTGDGKSALQDLILRKDRAKLQWKNLKEIYRDRLDEVIPAGEKFELVSIGNHCLGTKFLDGSHLINKELSETFDHISKQIEGFYFGRYDLRCASISDLCNGNIKVMELNGCGAEPAHIYQPGYSLRKAFSVLFTHWRNIFIIAHENAKRGVPYTPFKEAMVNYRKFKAATQGT
ncbi:MAG: D-alanine--D-alanine ligase [Marivirga sp.]|nr:D-alanine--D-alanine ligase [Marivirga sp.]